VRDTRALLTPPLVFRFAAVIPMAVAFRSCVCSYTHSSGQFNATDVITPNEYEQACSNGDESREDYMDEDTRDSIMNVLVPKREEWECDGGFADFLEGVDFVQETSEEGVQRGFVFKSESEYDAAI
jgi:hypothetical protein